MAWNFEWRQQHKEKYGCFQNTYRVKGEPSPKTDYVYLGSEESTVKILSDLALKPLTDEENITYSGEVILEKVADSLSFENILFEYAKDKRASNALKNTIILMALSNASKRKLFMKILNNSILRESTDLKYLEEVYWFMDMVYENIGDIVYDMIKAARSKYKIDLQYLIVDATRFKVYKDEETGLIKFGYPAQKRKDLPQVNVFLGVNNQQIPFFVSTHPGNTSDIEMFDNFLKTMRSKYRMLNKIPRKIIIMDQGNVNKDTIKYLRWLVREGFRFIAMIRAGSIGRFIKILDEMKLKKEDLDLIYTKNISKNKGTKIYGKLIAAEVYGRTSQVLVCYNPDVEKGKNKTLDGKIKSIKEKVEKLNKQEGSLDNKLSEVNSLIGERNLKQAFTVIKKENTLELKMNRTCLFNWDDVPGKGRNQFLKFLKNDLKIYSVKNGKIEKTDDGKTIKFINKENSITLKLNEPKNKVTVKTNYGKTYEYILEIEKSKLKVCGEYDINLRREKFGFFALFTQNKDIIPKDIITIYKSRDIVEKGFEVLNTEMDVCPINHSKDQRIETHIIFKIYGYFFVSLLRAILKDKKIDYSFSELIYTIKSGSATVGYYDHEIFKDKRLYVKRPTLNDELIKIFKILKIKIPKHDIKLEPYNYISK